ncbi:MAG TPA: TonB-dependent receptor [Candidatus Sulfotelmatobacter sp.]|nr:TonB-dependent receptor [Candidatus Sulfotelmatobacter sp.]
MRFACVALVIFFQVAAASAADIKIKVVDPQSAAVAGAQVSLSVPGTGLSVRKLATTSAEGVATFTGLPSSSFQMHVQVLAAGFAPYTEIDPSPSRELVTVHLQLATASETVVVSATRTPVLGEAAGADVDTLSGAQLTTMQPIAANDAVRFLPGAVIDTAGQHGGLASLFVRGGESTYNKVIVDGVALENPGLSFDFGTLPLTEADRMEFVRGAQSTLYGSDAMTSVFQVWSRTGSTRVPELRFGADGGNFGTASGYASLSGARGRYDYNLFGNQFNTEGFGVNDAYSNSLEGANVGVAINDRTALRVRFRHSNSNSGVPGEWNFNGDPLFAPNPSESSHVNNLLGSVELTVAAPSGWQHRFTAFDSLYRYSDINLNSNFASYDSFPDTYINHDNRVGFEYQGDYSERSWTHTTFGYRVENENGFINDMDFPPPAPGQRLEQDVYVQQQVTCGTLTAIAGGRFVHSSAFGNTGIPRVALTLQALRGGEIFSGTRLRFSYATGFMEPALYQTFGALAYGYASNPGLLPVRTRSFEAGLQQRFFAGRWNLNGTYFNNLFHDQIEAQPTPTGEYQFFNLEQSFAHGAEIEVQGQIRPRVFLTTAYTYTSSQVLENPLCTVASPCSQINSPGYPLIHRPKHSASLLLSYLGRRWGGNLSGSFVGRRADSDFAGFGIDHAAGYVRADLGGWYAVHPRVTLYANVENALDRRYNEVVGYPALPVNFRAGVRFRIGGE